MEPPCDQHTSHIACEILVRIHVNTLDFYLNEYLKLRLTERCGSNVL